MGRRRRLLVSDLALAEIASHPRADIRKGIERQLRKLRPKVLGPGAAVHRATKELMEAGGWGPKVVADVTQLGYALVGGAEAFATWNQADLARDRVRKIVKEFCERHGREIMKVGTPLEVAEWLGVRLRT